MDHARPSYVAGLTPDAKRRTLLAQVRPFAIDAGIRRCAAVFKQHGIGLVSRATTAQLEAALADLNRDAG